MFFFQKLKSLHFLRIRVEIFIVDVRHCAVRCPYDMTVKCDDSYDVA